MHAKEYKVTVSLNLKAGIPDWYLRYRKRE